MTNRNYRIVTYKQAFEDVLGLKFDERLKRFVSNLEKQGHTEKSISYAIWRTRETLLNYVPMEDSDIVFSGFMEILRFEISKYSWTKDDPRWKEHDKNKKREVKINEYAKRLNVNDFIYFMQGENGGTIRIGYTINPNTALKSLESGYPDKLKILLVIPGHSADAIRLQRKFDKHKLKGGWFKPDKEIFDEIEKLKAKYPHMVGD
jgi:hypothetical protein